jgi:hypothetical protein
VVVVVVEVIVKPADTKVPVNGAGQLLVLSRELADDEAAALVACELCTGAEGSRKGDLKGLTFFPLRREEDEYEAEAFDAEG